jgi:hypothetical protein
MIPRILRKETSVAGARTTPSTGTRKPAARRKYDAEKTRREILSVATREFARNGYNGARIDAMPRGRRQRSG